MKDVPFAGFTQFGDLFRSIRIVKSRTHAWPWTSVRPDSRDGRIPFDLRRPAEMRLYDYALCDSVHEARSREIPGDPRHFLFRRIHVRHDELRWLPGASRAPAMANEAPMISRNRRRDAPSECAASPCRNGSKRNETVIGLFHRWQVEQASQSADSVFVYEAAAKRCLVRGRAVVHVEDARRAAERASRGCGDNPGTTPS